jgi:DNA replication and repair protein RecF
VKIRELAAEGWRNLEPLVLRPGSRLSVLYGNNGQGKTNVLEAAYYLAALRSFRTSHAEDLIKRDHPTGRARLRADVVHEGLDRRFEIELGPTGRTARLDGKVVRGTAAALGAVSVVLFVPEDLLLPRAAPAARRRFLDVAVFNIDRAYYQEASAFQKVLKSRNALLRRGLVDRALLETYDEELARTGARVVMRRRALVAALSPLLTQHFSALHGNLPVALTYRSDPEVAAAQDEAQVIAALAQGLATRRALDERRRFTGFGPQADDLDIALGGALARSHASQGQLRSLVLALKLAELSNVEARLGAPPVLLLDDVPSELDPVRRAQLFEVIARLDCQTLISVTEREIVGALLASSASDDTGRIDFNVQAGRITKAS